MKLFVIKTLVTLLGVFLIASVVKSQPTGHDIMLNVEGRPDGDSRKSIMHMELTNKRGAVRVRTMLSYSKDYGDDKKTIMYFQAPADVKGTGFLTWDYNDETKTDDRWLYLPAMKKTRRISGSSAKKEYFMGSDFTYDDMSKQNVSAENHQLIKEEELNGYKCWVIESTPKTNDDIYSKKIGWVRQDNYVLIKVDFYERSGGLMKTLEVHDVKKIDGFWTATSMMMTNHYRNHKTLIRFESMQYNIVVYDNMFTVNSLEKGYID